MESGNVHGEWNFFSKINKRDSTFIREMRVPENFSYEKVLFFTQLSYHLMCKLLEKNLTCYLLSRALVFFPTLFENMGKKHQSTLGLS